MMVFNAPPKLLQDIAAVVGVQVAIADTDEQEARWIAEWLGTGDQAALVYGDADLGAWFTLSGSEVDKIPNTEFGSRAWFAGIDDEIF